jgi:ribonuclease P protein component
MERLTRRADFRAASRGKRASAGAFVLQARPRADRDGARVGFTVSRQVGNAVERNRVRRRLREIVRLMAGRDMRAGHDYVLIGRRAALAAPFSQLRADLDATLGRIHAADAAAGRGGTGGSRDHALHEPGSLRPDLPPAPPPTPPKTPRRNLRDA